MVLLQQVGCQNENIIKQFILSFFLASCMICKRKVNAEVIKEEIFNQTIPKCGICPEPETVQVDPPETVIMEDPHLVPQVDVQQVQQLPVMKPDIVFFGEGLPDHFHECISRSDPHLVKMCPS